jgi:hypothetical protein
MRKYAVPLWPLKTLEKSAQTKNTRTERVFFWEVRD